MTKQEKLKKEKNSSLVIRKSLHEQSETIKELNKLMSKENKILEEYRKKFGLCDGSLKHCGCKRELDFISKAIDQTRRNYYAK